MFRKCIDSTAGHKFVTEYGFSDTNFLYAALQLFAYRVIFHCTCTVLNIFVLPVKSLSSYLNLTHLFYYRHGHFWRVTLFEGLS